MSHNWLYTYPVRETPESESLLPEKIEGRRSKGEDRGPGGRSGPLPGRGRDGYCVQVGRVPQAMPWAVKASQMRQALGVPLARLPSSSSADR